MYGVCISYCHACKDMYILYIILFTRMCVELMYFVDFHGKYTQFTSVLDLHSYKNVYIQSLHIIRYYVHKDICVNQEHFILPCPQGYMPKLGIFHIAILARLHELQIFCIAILTRIYAKVMSILYCYAHKNMSQCYKHFILLCSQGYMSKL